MDVTKSNFKDLMPEIAKDLEESSFVAFDGEFTGLASERNIMPFDTSQEYYEKQLKTSKGFILVQLGLTFFKAQKDENDPEAEEKIKLKSYNVYVYPQSRTAVFSCHAQSLSFLASNKFDFNKLFSSGISYCKTSEEEVIRQEVKEKQDQRMEQLKVRTRSEEVDISHRNFIPVPDSEKEVIATARDKIQNVVDGTVTETMLDAKLNPFQRKLIYELIEREFNNKVSTSVRTIENRKIMVVETKRTAEEEMQVEKNKQKDDEVYLMEAIGLRLLMKEISASKKLIVGHNCLLDLMYLITQCFEDLPTDYTEFKILTHRLFPNIVDTKFIASSDKFKEMFPSSILNQVYQQLTKSPFEKVAYEFESRFHAYDLENPKEHEAGFDSFLTGYCLLVILKHLKVPISNFEPTKCKQLTPFLNRIALTRIQTPFIYLTGKEAVFPRTHVFYIKFPSTWQSSDVQDHFKNYGPVHCAWVNNSSAFVSLYQKENASCVLKTIARPAGFEIQSFSEYQQAEVEQKRDVNRKRKKEDSESSESSSKEINGSGKPVEAKEKRKTRRGGRHKKVFAECDQW